MNGPLFVVVWLRGADSWVQFYGSKVRLLVLYLDLGSLILDRHPSLTNLSRCSRPSLGLYKRFPG